jgi:hypothetical protein
MEFLKVAGASGLARQRVWGGRFHPPREYASLQANHPVKPYFVHNYFVHNYFLIGAEPGSANSSESSCTNTNFVSIPSRPTVTSATDTTACGVAELEYGLERQWPGGGANRDDLSGGLRFGLTPKLDFHWFSSDFVHLMNREGDRTGYGDNWLPACKAGRLRFWPRI